MDVGFIVILIWFEIRKAWWALKHNPKGGCVMYYSLLCLWISKNTKVGQVSIILHCVWNMSIVKHLSEICVGYSYLVLFIINHQHRTMLIFCDYFIGAQKAYLLRETQQPNLHCTGIDFCCCPRGSLVTKIFRNLLLSLNVPNSGVVRYCWML